MNVFIIVVLFAIIALLFDLVWFYFVGDFVKSEIGSIARLSKDGAWEVGYLPALLVYLLLGLGAALLVFPSAEGLWRVVLLGGLLGLVTYGVYDLTNLATLSSWTMRLVVVDIAWGTFLCATVSGLVYLIVKSFF
ncbi:MAG: DUF2177 family protein [Candidatus Pacebacteria bacterium]|nr:DUF2177 family protein [Candidatus Paceibacterota bacterium]